MSSEGSSINDQFIMTKKMKPFWVFADLCDGKYVGGPYLCFINAHYPNELASPKDDVNKRGAERLKDGTWKAEELKTAPPNTKIGWGVGKTPQEAFRKACFNSGHLQVKDVTQ